MKGLSNWGLGAAILLCIAFIGVVESVGGVGGLALMLAGIAVLGLAALRWGYDSQDGRNWKPLLGLSPKKTTHEHERLSEEHLPDTMVDAVIETMEKDFRRSA